MPTPPARDYPKAIEFYTKAIECDAKNAIFYSNRATCHIHMENFGLAIADAAKGIEMNPKYVKSYYRRAWAYAGLGKYKDAISSFREVLKIKPGDAQAQKKLKECKKALFEQQFAKAIQGDDQKKASEVVTTDSMTVGSDYTGPKLPESGVTLEFVKDMIEHLRAQKNLHKKYVYRILLAVIKLFKSLPTLVDIPVPQGKHFTVCGDVHGQFYDVLNIFEINGLPSTSNPYLFNGDFVDRGSFAVPVILTFFAFKLLYPNAFHMTRGNHETITMNSIYGFQGEVLHKYDKRCFDLFTEAFNLLPLGAVLERKVLVVHGGLFSRDGVTLDDIRKINRNRQPPESGLMCEVLWSDPQPFNGRAPSKRGVGLSFGPDVTKRFLKENKLELLVRSHEVKASGYEVMHDGKCITVFSAPNYVDQMGNKGAFIRFEHDMKPKFTSFDCVPHPPMRPMAYSRGLGFM